MRFALFVAAALSGVLAVGCKGDPFRPDAADVPIDADKPPWFRPLPNEVKEWDIQLAGYNLTRSQKMVIVNLWDVVPNQQTITYEDGSTVSVPPGVQPTAITTLHGISATAICHVGTGAIRLTDPDAMKLDGYQATPPNKPTPPASGSVIGWSVTADDPQERFVDYRDADARKILLARVKLAKTIGCDGIAAYRNDLSAFTTEVGFSAVAPQQDVEWIKLVAEAAHTEKLSVGGRGLLSNNIDQVKLDYDWLLVERCGELDDCDNFRPFTAAMRSVFGLDYTMSLGGTTNTTDVLCPRWRDALVDGIMKPAALDGTAPVACSAQ